MAASATFALKAGVWFRRGRLLIVSPDSRGTACPLSGRNSTYRPVQILEAGSICRTLSRARPLSNWGWLHCAARIISVKQFQHPTWQDGENHQVGSAGSDDV